MGDVLHKVFGPAEMRGDEIIIISGTAPGADRMGEVYANEFHHQCERYPADWDRYGKSAGYKRNEEMARVATHLVAFWDGDSRGTRHMIDLAVKHNLEVRVFSFAGNILEIHHSNIANVPVVGLH